jgi:hypothetical protein
MIPASVFRCLTANQSMGVGPRPMVVTSSPVSDKPAHDFPCELRRAQAAVITHGHRFPALAVHECAERPAERIGIFSRKRLVDLAAYIIFAENARVECVGGGWHWGRITFLEQHKL